jgi:catechol-2,3-dioxygenase
MRMHIGHVALQVEDIHASARHATERLGLRVTHSAPTEIRLSANAKAHELQLISGRGAGLDHVGLEVESDSDLEEVRDRVISAGARILGEEAEEGLASALRFVGPADIVYEVYTGMKRDPLSIENIITPFARKLGHLTFFSDELDDVLSFWIHTLGFRVSDRVGDAGAWLRCDPDHHGLAAGRSAEPGTRLHHYAFELQGFDTVGAYADNLARIGDGRVGDGLLWGPGRHGPGRNIFTYARDPAGCLVEAYTDLLRIDDDAAYQPIDWSTVPSAMNLWGPDMPADWDVHGVPVVGAGVEHVRAGTR